MLRRVEDEPERGRGRAGHEQRHLAVHDARPEDDGDIGHVDGEDAGLVGVIALARAEPEGFLLRGIPHTGTPAR
eukprot:5336909-Alexandrium_andersonii.AAC.1